MPTERLVIEVSERGARVVSGDIRRIGDSARSAEGGVSLLRRALGALVTAGFVRQLVRTADAFTNIQNRLRLVTESTTQLNAVQNELLRISNETRTAFETNANLFNRLALSTRELGLTQREVLQLTESLNQAVIISGASGTEASAGLIQLSQGLAAGALRGDELRSVLEQLPAVADVIATELGVTRGELRELGQQGEITADVVTRAFANAREELAERFGRTVPSIGQGFTTLGNSLVNFGGRLLQAVGISDGLSRALLGLSGFVDDITQGFVEAALRVREFVEVGTIAVVTFADRAAGRFNQVEAFLANVAGRVTGNRALEARAEAVFLSQEERVRRSLETLDDEFEAIRRNAEARREAALSADPGALDLQVQGGGDVNTVVDLDNATQKLVDSQLDLLVSLRQEEEALRIASETGRDYETALNEIQIRSVAATTGNVDLANVILATQERVDAARRSLDQYNDLLEEGRQLTEALREPSEIFEDQLDSFRELYDAGAISAGTFARATREALEELTDATELGEAEDDFTDFLRRARENSQDILGDALTNAFTGGLDEIPARFSQLLLQLASQFFASEIFRSLSNLGQGGGGGFLTNLLGPVGDFFGGRFNQGGQFQVPQVGGGGPDSVRTTMDLTPRETVTITPAGQAPPGQAAAPVVNVPQPKVVVVDSVDKARQFLNSEEGAGAVLTILRDNPEAARQVTA